MNIQADNNGNPAAAFTLGTTPGDKVTSSRLGKLGFALLGGILTINSYVIDYLLPNQHFAAMISAFAGAVVIALPIIFTAFRDLRSGKVQMNELVALAILAALAGGDLQMAGLIGFLLLLTLIIESRTASGAKRSIEQLVKLTPNTARLLEGDEEREVEARTLKIGNIIRVRPGENFPVDAVIVSGESTVNQASITGESVPVEKEVGNEVFAGTQNLTGLLTVKVTRIGEETTLGKVKDMIMQAESSRTPIVRIIDRYASYYTPTILMVAGLTWGLSGDKNNVIALMVIACPCAVVLATPSAVVAAVAAAARLGIFIKNVAHLELAAKISAFVFDKTGTLTDGLLSVVKLAPFDEISPSELLGAAAAAEQNSNHPTAQAVMRLAAEAGVKAAPAEEFSEEHGKGVRAKVDGKEYLVGRVAYLESLGIVIPEHESDEAAQGMSTVYVSCDGKVLGWIGMKDKLRREAAEMITSMRKEGIKHIAMVTGDRESVALQVADNLQLDEYISGCLPETKAEYVEKMKHNAKVAVVGDGVNDAPALAAGDLGIAMGAIGSDIAISSASIALMTNDLRRIPMLVFLSRRSQKIILQNLIIGMLFVLGGIILAVFGKLDPIYAALLQVLSTIIVIFNSARLVRTGEELTLQDRKMQNL